jgi:hypothetical protein
VIVLDENILASQRTQLRSWRVHLCQVGDDVGRSGMHDDEIIPLLLRLRRPSLVSRDRDFFKRALRNNGYCLMFLDAPPLKVAKLTRRVLRHPDFRTWSQRRGCVMRVSVSGVLVWRLRASRIARYD